jgi:DNA-binding transcriptional ArsR family regulator
MEDAMALNEVFKAIADPNRREILTLLRQRPHTAGEIAERFDLTKPTVSHHLNQLKDADLIYGVRDGTRITYHLNMTVFEELVASLLSVWKGEPHAPDAQK